MVAHLQPHQPQPSQRGTHTSSPPSSWDPAAADRPLVLRLPSGLLPTEDVDSMDPPNGSGDRRPFLYSAQRIPARCCCN